MKICSICGCYNAADARSCQICGVHFPEPKGEVPEYPVPNPEPSASPASTCAPQRASEDNKPDRMALAGFILSLMGFVTCMTSPLQLAALILSLSAGKVKKFRILRLIGIILSAVALGVSLLLWLIVSFNADMLLPYISDAMNKLYY